MYCVNCGASLTDGTKFCPFCGKSASGETETAADAAAQGRRISDNITLCPDGKYRWVYELHLLKEPTIFFLIWKIFFFIVTGIFAFTFIIDTIEWGLDDSLGSLKVYGYLLLGMTVLIGLGYLLYAAIMGGKYCVMFEMDEQGVNHKQMPRQAKKAELLSAITVLAGLAGGRLTTVGVGLTSSRTEMYSEFSRVKKVKAYPRRGLIKVNGTLSRNQVYAEREDFDFVLGYIRARCPDPKAKKEIKR
jgi:hypothetical protein